MTLTEGKKKIVEAELSITLIDNKSRGRRKVPEQALGTRSIRGLRYPGDLVGSEPLARPDTDFLLPPKSYWQWTRRANMRSPATSPQGFYLYLPYPSLDSRFFPSPKKIPYTALQKCSCVMPLSVISPVLSPSSRIPPTTQYSHGEKSSPTDTNAFGQRKSQPNFCRPRGGIWSLRRMW